jgi:hypothetical protein
MTLQILAGGDKIDNTLWKDAVKEERQYQLSWPVPANSSRSEKLYIEGFANSAGIRDVKFKATIQCPAGTVGGINYAAASAHDNRETTVYEVDLDIDSLNDNGYAAEGYDDAEDRIEASEKEEYGVKKPGKIVVSGINADTDGDGTPDFADLETEGGKFVPVRVQLKEPFDPEKAYVRFDYTESKPEESQEGWTVTGAGTAEDPEVYTLHTGGMRLWKKDAPSRTADDFIPPDEDHPWTEIADGSSRTKTLYLEYVDKETPEAAGRQEITVTAMEEDAECEDKVVATLLPVEVVPDYNRDGMINDEDRGKVTEEKPFVFWLNDDDDGNTEPHYGDIPGTNTDGADMVVNDLRDLVDFFPVQLRIKEMLKVLPEDEYTYKISHPTGAFHFIEMPDVHPDSNPEAQGAGSYLRNQTMADDAMARPMNDTAGDGSELSIEYLDAVKNDMGVLLFESTSATNQSFELIVTKNGGGEVARITRAIPVEMVEVEKMFWRSNIRPAAAGQAPEAVVKPTSEKFKASRKDQWFVFCHGYNVSEEAAREWNSEVFKRLHQEGSDARFVGITWEGNQGQFDVSLFFEKMFTPDYWRNAYNAFSSSHALATEINGLTGSSKSKTVIAAHSLGNMVVSSAICDHGLKAGQYFMFNSAVPREAYSAAYAALDRGNMRNPDWQNYPTRLWSTDWNDLYAANDGRNKLTWQNRFASLLDKTTPFNYYSTGEDVAAGSVDGGKPSAITVAIKGSGAWISQEMNKGLATKAAINGSATGNWSAGGGWAFNIDHYSEYRPNPLDPPPPGGYPDTSAITDGQLKVNPFFKPFTKLELVNGGANPAADGTDITTQAGSAHASQYAIRAWMLAHEIPSLSLPTASGALPGVSEGADMETSFKSGHWGNVKWTHSAMKERDPLQVRKLYENMCDKGILRKP